MKILLFGRGGQVGWELQRSLSVLGELVALDFDPASLDAILVTHEHDVAAWARRRIVFRDGRIVEDTRGPARQAVPA